MNNHGQQLQINQFVFNFDKYSQNRDEPDLVFVDETWKYFRQHAYKFYEYRDKIKFSLISGASFSILIDTYRGMCL